MSVNVDEPRRNHVAFGADDLAGSGAGRAAHGDNQAVLDPEIGLAWWVDAIHQEAVSYEEVIHRAHQASSCDCPLGTDVPPVDYKIRLDHPGLAEVVGNGTGVVLSLIHISEPTRRT